VKSLLALVAVLALAFWLGGSHIVHKLTDWQLFGCKETYINAKGEDTGECQ
jgi:hypothetical protein